MSGGRQAKVLLMTLSERTSGKGRRYFSGWLGKASVVAFEGGSVREVVEDGATGFIVRDVAGAAAAVARLSELSRAAVRRRVEERFTARRMARDYLGLYGRLASGHGAETPVAEAHPCHASPGPRQRRRAGRARPRRLAL